MSSNTDRMAHSIGDVRALARSWHISMSARNLAPNTIASYAAALESFAAFALETGMPTEAASITREHVETWEASIANYATRANRHTGLEQFWKWCVEEGEITVSPMANMRKPRIPETQAPMLSPEQIAALFKACGTGSRFEARRDTAIVRMLIDTGLRLSELANLRWSEDARESDVDLIGRTVTVLAKGRKPLTVGLGAKSTRDLDRYLRDRRSHHDADLPWMWLGRKGRMTGSGVRQMLERRGEQAGIRGLHPHLLRHLSTHMLLADGVNETDVMTLRGWRSRAMLRRYGAALATERAIDSHRRHSPGDRL